MTQLLAWTNETFPWLSEYADLLKGAAALFGLGLAAIAFILKQRNPKRGPDRDWEFAVIPRPVHKMSNVAPGKVETYWVLRIANTGLTPFTVHGATFKMPRQEGQAFNLSTKPDQGNFPVVVGTNDSVELVPIMPVELDVSPWTERARDMAPVANRPFFTVNFGNKLEDCTISQAQALMIYGEHE